MSYISSRTTALAAAVFTLFVASPALAKTTTHHHQHARVLMQAGYAAPVTRLLYQPASDSSRDCDLPSSGCTDGMRISN
jgi:hypothetical protein